MPRRGIVAGLRQKAEARGWLDGSHILCPPPQTLCPDRASLRQWGQWMKPTSSLEDAILSLSNGSQHGG